MLHNRSNHATSRATLTTAIHCSVCMHANLQRTFDPQGFESADASQRERRAPAGSTRPSWTTWRLQSSGVYTNRMNEGRDAARRALRTDSTQGFEADDPMCSRLSAAGSPRRGRRAVRKLNFALQSANQESRHRSSCAHLQHVKITLQHAQAMLTMERSIDAGSDS
jgi:hypothetical protein